jgi:hypothetical protein
MTVYQRFKIASDHLKETGAFKFYDQMMDQMEWSKNDFNHLRGRAKELGVENLEKLKRIYPEINWAWVATGSGEMLQIENSVNETEGDHSTFRKISEIKMATSRLAAKEQVQILLEENYKLENENRDLQAKLIKLQEAGQASLIAEIKGLFKN